MNREELQNVLKSLMLAASVAGVGFVGIGCDDSADDNANDAIQESNENASDAVSDAQSTMEDTKNNLAGEAQDQAGKAADTLGSVSDSMKDLREEGVAALDGLEGEALVTKAKEMVEKVQTYIKEGKLDEAKSMLAKLDQYKEKLPDTVVAQLDNVKSLLDKAESAGDAAAKLKQGAGGMLDNANK